MRPLIYCLFFAFTIPTNGQNSEELRKLYGQPRATSPAPDSEKFAFHDKFDLIAQYGPDLRACKLMVTSVHAPTDPMASFIPNLYVPILLQEIAPGTVSGAKKSDVELPAVRVIDFEEARVLEPVAQGLPLRKGVSQIMVFFKRAICPLPDDPIEFFERKVLPLIPGSRELRTRFGVNKGENDLSQDVVLVSDIKLEVSYCMDGRACFIKLTPVDRLKDYMPSPQVAQLIETLVPPVTKGKLIGGGGFQSSECGGADSEEYEYVKIGRVHNFCERAHGGTDKEITIQFPRALRPKG